MADEQIIPAAEADLGPAYLTERSEAIRRDNDPDAWLDSLSNEQPNPEQPAESGQPTDKPAKPRDPVVAWLGSTLAPLAQIGAVQRTASDTAGRVASDVVKGVAVEGPGAIVRGATSAVNNLSSSVGSFANWAYDNLPDVVKGGGLDFVAKMREQNPDFKPGDAALQMPQAFDERDTTTGKTIELASQFLTSQAVAGKVSKAMGMAPSVYKRLVDAFTGGATGFDPKQDRLSNMIDEALPNPLTDFLKASEDDPELMARFKSGLEAAGLQAVSEGVTQAFKAVKAWRASKVPPKTPEATNVAPLAQTPQVADDAVPALQITANNDNFTTQAVAFLKGEVVDSPVKVNLDRFDGPESIKTAIADLSKLLPEDKVIPMETTLAQARTMGITPESVGTLFDRRQIAAGWMMFRSSADDLVKLADQARATGAPADLARFNAAFQTSYGILQTVKGQSAEIARALQIHAALRKSEPGMVKALQSMMDEAGGAAISMDMAEKVALLKDPTLAAKFIQEAGKATTRDQIVYAWSNVLLSNPASHVANVVDTSLSTLMQVPETWFASKFGGDVAQGEATAKLYGIVQGFKDGLKMAARTIRTGESNFTAPGSRVEIMANRPLPTSQDLARSGTLRQYGDYLKMLVPTRVMQAGDELTKAMNYRGEMHALAWREAVVKQGLEGAEASQYAAKLMSEAPEWLTKSAEAQAIKGTFNEPLQGFAASLAQAVDKANVGGVPVGRIVVPFVRTPTNLIRWAFHRTPAAFLSPQIQSEIAAGGATRDLALGRVAAGSAILASFADLASSGKISGAGPKDPALRANLIETGWQPYSFNVGGKWIAYGRSGTMGTLIGLAADATEMLSGVYSREKDTVTFEGEPVEDSVAAAVVFPFAQAITSKTYMSGLASLMDGLSDPARYGEGYVNRLASSMVPAVVGAMERTIDPEIRRAKDWLEAVQARVPGASEGLLPRLNRWGEARKDENGIYNLFLPARISEEKGSSIDREIERLKLGVSPPKQIQSFSQSGISQSVELSPEQHNKLIKLSGNELKLPVPGVSKPMGAKDYLDAIIDGNAGALSRRYQSGSDELRELIIRDVLSTYRAAAKDQILKENPDLAGMVRGNLQNKAEQLRTPRSANGAPTLQ